MSRSMRNDRVAAMQFLFSRGGATLRAMLLALGALLSLLMPVARADNGHWLTGYYAIYNNGTMTPDQVDYTHLTHVIFWPILPNTNGSLNTTAYVSAATFDSLAKEAVLQAHNNGRKVLLGVGGSQYAGASAGFKGATSSDNLNYFVENISSLVQQYGFDGVDINWEQIGQKPDPANPGSNIPDPTDDPKFLAFIPALRNKLNDSAQQLMLTMAPEVKGSGGRPDLLKQVYQDLDQINIQTYIMSGPYPGYITWFNSPLNNGGATFPSTGGPLPSITASLADYTAVHIPMSKLAIGIQGAAAVWKGGVVTGTTNGVTMPKQSWSTAPSVSQDEIKYRDIVNGYAAGFTAPVVDPDADQTWQASDPAGSANDQFITYDSPTSLAKKANDLHTADPTNSLGGVFMFELSEDYLSNGSHPLELAAYNMIQLLPGPVTSLHGTAGDTMVSLTWTAAPGASSYSLKAVSGCNFQTIYGIQGTSATIGGLINGNACTIQVAAVNAFVDFTPTGPTVTVTPVAGAGVFTPAPVFSPQPGTYDTNSYETSFTVSLSDAVANAQIYYTTDGSTPTTASTPYYDTLGNPQPIVISHNQLEVTISAIAAVAGFSPSQPASGTYDIGFESSSILPTPTLSPAPGTYAGAQTVTLKDTVGNAIIYYTTDGSTPTASSSQYNLTGPITVSGSETIKAMAVANGEEGQPSAVAGGAYVVTNQVATPHITPVTGAYAGTQTVTMSDATAGSTIYFTSDGTLPNNTSNKYTGQLTITSTKTIRAIAYATGLNPSAVATSALTIGNQVATPTFSPEPGPYAGTQTVYIFDSTAGSTIYFTSDGTPPSTASVKYTAPLTISSTKTLRAIAVKNGLSQSLMGTAPYTIGNQVATPVFSPDPGPYAGTQTVKIADVTPNSTIYFTSDGTTPSASSNKYTGVLTIPSTKTLKAIAYASGLSPSVVVNAPYTIGNQAATPVFSPDTGAYSGTQSVRILTPTAGATIYYTSNGATPTAASNKYTVPLTITADKTIKAIVVAPGLSNSAVSTAEYAIGGHVATPAISPGTGTYTSTQTVTLYDSTPGATIYFTSDGSTPTAASFKYTAPLTIASNKTINAIAVVPGLTNSAVANAAYTITTQAAAATPVISPATGTYTSAQTVTITDSTAGNSIYYTTNGSTPTTASTKYTAAFTVSSSETVKAIAVAAGFSNSGVATATYTINLPAAAAMPSFSLPANIYATAQTVTISDSTAGATIYYTTNGATPTTASSQYTTAITVSSTETLKAIAVAPGFTTSATASAAYAIDNYALWIPDYKSQNVYVHVGYGSSPKVVKLNTTPFNCHPNGLSIHTGTNLQANNAPANLLYVICNAPDEILVFDATAVKNAQGGLLNLNPIQTITNGGFDGLIAGAFDASGNLWVSSIGNPQANPPDPGSIFVLPAANLNSQTPNIYTALNNNTPDAPAGLAFDPVDGSLWIGGDNGGLFNIRSADLYTNGNTFSNQPTYYIGDNYARPSKPTLKAVEGVAVTTFNGNRVIWAANNAYYDDANGHEIPGLYVVPFTLGTAPTIQNGAVSNSGTLIAGTPITGSGSNAIQCPGGLFATSTHLWINDEGFMDTGPQPYCGDGNGGVDDASNVGAVISFTSSQLSTPGTILPAQEQLNVTSRPGFGGIYVENDH
jgi:GH18 family chitinase